MKSFGKNLKTLRELNKMSQVQFANKMNTTQQRVSEWECDKVEPSLHNILKMIKVLNTTFDELTDGLE
ncbi:MAG: helix-turn-helix transcriptional regulator [Clostridia bacterium]|nr:helix-turn-helix transcriptional regulator [Clostridia bacterium]